MTGWVGRIGPSGPYLSDAAIDRIDEIASNEEPWVHGLNPTP